MTCSYMDTKKVIVVKSGSVIFNLLMLISLFLISVNSLAASAINCLGMYQNDGFRAQDVVLPVSAVDVEAGHHLPIGTVIYRQYFHPNVIPEFIWSCHSPNEDKIPFFVTVRASWLLSSSSYKPVMPRLYSNIFQTNIPGVGVSIMITEAMADYSSSLSSFVDRIALKVCHQLDDGHCNGQIKLANEGIELILIKTAPILIEEDSVVLANLFPSFTLEVEFIESLLTVPHVKLSFSGELSLAEFAK